MQNFGVNRQSTQKYYTTLSIFVYFVYFCLFTPNFCTYLTTEVCTLSVFYTQLASKSSHYLFCSSFPDEDYQSEIETLD